MRGPLFCYPKRYLSAEAGKLGLCSSRLKTHARIQQKVSKALWRTEVVNPNSALTEAP